MIFEIPKDDIFKMLLKQIKTYFPISAAEEYVLKDIYPLALDKCEVNFSRNPNRYFHSVEHNGEAYFDPFHSGQWTIFLYYLSHLLYMSHGGGCPRTQYHMSENLQSVSSPDYSGLPDGCNNRLSGRNTSKSSRDAFNLKLESSQNGVLGRAGGVN